MLTRGESKLQQAIIAAIRLPSTIQKLRKDIEQTIEGEHNIIVVQHAVTVNNEMQSSRTNDSTLNTKYYRR